ncbi:glycosyltransferase family 1 protein [Heterobasidion irregulare TC 32-1]|uniref:UDP-N-acetylglucosamine transferase subunit ALG14 n=1 Tax=Heterobasidion irregulare (strain TC 32-1) TaxID=747525 RepID=W4K6Q4_HETIT|nr:glycosyltransferase family 1 protein [Heterobasidion irregulare TC 32-1]ETW80741.1 glycosyltransferase family 1 protein [Heterobasidion irregulare TC 32-1]
MTLAVILLLLSRVYFLRRERNLPRVRRSGTCSLAVFLGSGGHTMEALSLVNSLDFTRYTPRTYIVSEGDALSIQKARALERLKLSRNEIVAIGEYRVITIPRARHVHQKLFQTVPTALLSLLVSFYHVTVAPFFAAPISEVLLLNGPGTCFVLCIATYLNRLLGLPSPKLIYVESFARVKTLSLSGRLLRSMVDSFVVQWPDLLKEGGRGVYHGWLV